MNACSSNVIAHNSGEAKTERRSDGSLQATYTEKNTNRTLLVHLRSTCYNARRQKYKLTKYSS